MFDPLPFVSSTPRHALPLLFAGQAQKEAFVNEALVRIDALLHPYAEDIVADAPADPLGGQCWLVASSATGKFAGYENAVAVFDGGDFVFAAPSEGMIVRLKTGGSRVFKGGSWIEPPNPTAPSGGSVVDMEARGAIATLCDALRLLGAIS